MDKEVIERLRLIPRGLPTRGWGLQTEGRMEMTVPGIPPLQRYKDRPLLPSSRKLAPFWRTDWLPGF